MIKEATVKIDGLTVIAGENDTGKSTVGKALFCAVKSSAMSTGGFFYRNRNRYILGKLFGDLKNVIAITNRNQHMYSLLANKVNSIRKEVEEILKSDSHSEEKRLFLSAIQKLEDDPEISKLPLFEDIYNKLSEAMQDDFKNQFTATNFENIMSFAFSNDYFSHFATDKKLSVELKDEVRNQKLLFELGDEVNFIGNKIFDDATFIDTPVIFQIVKLLNDTNISDKEYMPTIKDLKQKLVDLPQKIEVWEQEEIKQIVENIQDVIGGDIIKDGSDFVYKKPHDTMPIKIENVATGIKSFGLLILLLKQGYINDKSVMILDEPEVHLHPRWQLEMARIIVELVKYGVKIVVNSHSPYMIEALKVYSDKEKIQSQTNFYLTEIDGNSSNESIKDVTVDLEPIFIKLAEPYRKLESELR